VPESHNEARRSTPQLKRTERQDLRSKPAEVRPGKRALTLLIILCIGLMRSVRAETPTVIPIAPEPVGSGARALGQSAFIAVADDATAASWNPAGLINLEKPETSFVGVWRTIADDFSARATSWNGGTWSLGEINFMSYACPIAVGSTDIVISLNYHQVYDFGLEYSGAGEEGIVVKTTETTSRGALSAYSLAGGLSLSSFPSVTIGTSFNWFTQSLLDSYVRQVKTTELTVIEGDGPPLSYETTEALDDFRGYNFTFGLLWDVYEKEQSRLTLGFVCHTPFSAKVDQELMVIEPNVPRAPPTTGRLNMDFPLSLGAGLNYRFCDGFSTALDVQWTDWSQYTYVAGATSSSPLRDDALAVRLGFERLWFSARGRESVYALRGGVFYEPRPAWSDILPVYGLSLGLGWTVQEKSSLDFAYQFRWGEGKDFTADGSSYFDYGIEEHWLIGSVIVYFR
jgi:long-subunit fatty acid transport protein